TWRLRKADSGKELAVLKGHTDGVLHVSFSPDGRRLASASDDQTVRLWEADSGKELITLKGHAGDVYRVLFSPDGRRLASAGRDGTVWLWISQETPDEVAKRRRNTWERYTAECDQAPDWFAAAFNLKHLTPDAPPPPPPRPP